MKETDRDAVNQSKRLMFIFIFHIGENTDSLKTNIHIYTSKKYLYIAS